MEPCELEQRVAVLEAELARLREEMDRPSVPEPPWWEKIYGTFANDPAYEEAMRLGRAWREAPRPGLGDVIDAAFEESEPGDIIMSKVILDRSVLARLGNLKERVEVCDDSGRTVGYFTPATGQAPDEEMPFSGEQLDRFEREPGGRSLAEILADLGRNA